jgi:hypothetical protein
MGVRIPDSVEARGRAVSTEDGQRRNDPAGSGVGGDVTAGSRPLIAVVDPVGRGAPADLASAMTIPPTSTGTESAAPTLVGMVAVAMVLAAVVVAVLVVRSRHLTRS